MKRMLVVIAGLVLAGCGVVLAPVDPALVIEAQRRFPDATEVELLRGREVLRTKCTQCHGVRDPRAYDEKAWTFYVGEMSARATLTLVDKQALLRYALVARDAPLPP